MTDDAAKAAIRRGAALALAVTGSLVLTACGGDGEAASGEGNGNGDGLEASWATTPAPSGEYDGALPAPRLWVAESTVVVAGTAGVTAYDRASGEPGWELPAPDGAGELCAASDSTNAAGVGALLYAAADDPESCSVVVAVDAGGEGQPLWTGTMPSEGSSYGAEIFVGDEAITASNGDVAQFSIEGEPVALPEVPGGPECVDGADWTASASHLFALSDCGTFGDAYQLSAFPTAGGEALWTLENASEDYRLANGMPGDLPTLRTSDDLLVTFGETGEPVSEVPADNGTDEWDFSPALHLSLVQGATLLAGSLTMSVDGGEGAAYDLATGEEIWREPLPSLYDLFPGTDGALLMDGDGIGTATGVIAFEVDPATGSRTELGAITDLPTAATVVDGTLYALLHDEEEDTTSVEAYPLS
ncbi:PQQ-binding-like beta-propeller repeat protein [Streptomyces radicis]|uniref:PQQ-binding-like beta-propeller repeat protein n=1 Tax=Streptomyces radicis TaxID=1750517 RepID=A0A3A9WDW3_9ACTN|nr:PQQ-binding-like beta-propeller repeat protein [Streptomyces radicis]RKN07594.1 hypothetical protein D7319_18200 [Streptomyces radicis]RKN18317.1 hypothetical protein D7318_22435 [Streptomyces radicis]